MSRIGRACLLVGLLLAAGGCDEEQTLSPSEQLLKSLAKAGFRIEPAQVQAQRVNHMLDYVTSECYHAYHHPTDLNLCFHHFKTGIKALEARTALERMRLPEGRFWALAVRGRSLVLVDSRLKDRPIALKLLSFFSGG